MKMSQVNIEPISGLIQALWESGGTDIHIGADAPPMMRVDGDLHPFPGHQPLHADDVESILEAMLPAELLAQFEVTRQVDFSFSWKDATRFRGNAFRQRGAVSLALRAIPYQIPTMEELLLPPVMETFCNSHQGLVLITGPTGSGKSTTQAAMIGRINATRRRHILTLEDPIEYVHSHQMSMISQREVGFDTPTFQDGLKAALREDPDVVLVGEMRDPESIATTLTIAETGHLVFATLHTNDASTAIDRIIDVFPSERQAQIRVQLASSLAGVVAQRLVPRQDGGMIAAFEILLANNPVRALIRDGKTHQIRNVIAQSVRDGMQTLEQSLSVLIAHDLISHEEALARAVVPTDIRTAATHAENNPAAGAVPVA
ncbi:type IV pilus twitching motility protein PilT [Aquihabitans sp. McL0605]|uniref:type IV pilus twitching motility protein PilT n=1 Tax=Aquihabitans sp. McL0605 TaxID=3415671 RepID=UPI003CF2FE99